VRGAATTSTTGTSVRHAASPRLRAVAARARTQTKTDPPIRLRLGVLLLAMVLAFGALGVRLFQLQARDQRELSSLGVGQRLRTVELAAERGSIFDRNGVDLAVSVPQTTITADPRVIKDPAGYAAVLAPIVGVDQVALEDRLAAPHSAFAYVARKVDDKAAAKVRALGLTGISFVPESKRFYPQDRLAAPVLGFVGTDNNGLGGLEYLYESTLKGKSGSVQVERDPQGNAIPGGEHRVRAAERGQDLVLTLDRYLQFKTEQVLTAEVDRAGAKGGMAILADVRTGDILAMATVDGATNTEPTQPAPATELSAPVATMYEPGSTNKVITMAAAIQEGLVSPSTEIANVGPSIRVGDKDYQDVEAHGSTMTVADILRESSNVGTIKIASMLGSERFDHYLRAFGFGHQTTLGLPGESNGLLLPLQNYNSTSMGSMPIGNGIAVTAIQMLDVYMTIANGGIARPPRIIAATVDAHGNREDVPLLPPHLVVSTETAKSVTEMLADVVRGGTGVKAAVAGYTVAGKTGTARKPPYTGAYMASFVGFAPAESPRLAAIVVLDEPRSGSYYGGDVAAPAFSLIMQEALRVERVPPTAPAASTS
jgi:cell division protein FtsI (penicillin-binding protein 3)